MAEENRDMEEGNHRNDNQKIVPGMHVEATEGDLGEQDVSPAKVTDIKLNQQGDVEAIKLSKGVLFKKELGFTCISSAMALLGATISPYSMFWQAQAEIEEKRGGSLKQQLRTVRLDMGSGAVAGQLVAYFIIITTASTLFVHHASITTAADAARSLEPLAGPLARYLFAIGLIGSGVVAIPVLLASTSYAVSGAVGWPGALAKRPWQSEGFYLVLTVATVVAMVITLLRVDPIKLIFWSNILAAIIAPLLVIAILLVGNHRTIMKNQRLSLLHNFGLVLIVLILIVGAVLLFYGLATGRGI